MSVNFYDWAPFAESLPSTVWSGSFGSHGNAIWTVGSNDYVYLPAAPGQNSAPSTFCSPLDVTAIGYHMEGKMKVPDIEGKFNKKSGGTDDDFFGFAVGFDVGDFFNPNPSTNATGPTEYYVFDWKREDQEIGKKFNPCSDTKITAKKGLSAIKVNGQPAKSEFWTHEDAICDQGLPTEADPGTVTELARGNTLSSTGWGVGEENDFCLEVTKTTIKLSINGTEEIFLENLDLPDSTRFCLYTFSQDDSMWYDVTIEPLKKAGCDGDPHFKTWTEEHFEYHGQCDLVLAKDPGFADGLGLDVHIRTKLVRYWSYIKSAVIRIGNDILEVEGASANLDGKVHYLYNYEYQGELTEFAGFPVTIRTDGTKNVERTFIEIDLSSKYPGQKIIFSTFKEFVKVQFENSSEESYGNTVGMLGDYKTGKTVGRDGVTVINDFTKYGHEWQVLPADGKFFRESSKPQFPQRCIEPEDPRGERKRRLAESTVTLEDAEAACAGLKDELDRKDCVYDIIATQDMDMVGAY